MKEKEIVQIGSPIEIYTFPKNLFVASFIGDINVLKGKILEKSGNIFKIETDEGLFYAETDKEINSNDVFLCFRPESISKEEKINVIKGKIKDYEFLGEYLKLVILTEKGNLFKISLRPEEFENYKKEDNIVFSIKKEKFMLFEK